jgi:hypothetical protein
MARPIMLARLAGMQAKEACALKIAGLAEECQL